MVITTNILDREALCEQITERTVSRLTEMCDDIPLIGEDRRVERRWDAEPAGRSTEFAGPSGFARRF